MTIFQFIKSFFKSPFGALTITFSIVVALVVSLFVSWFIGIVSGFALLVIMVIVGLYTKVGITSAITTHETETWMTVEAQLEKLEQNVRTIKTMRFTDEHLSRLVAQITFRSEKYIAICRQNKTHDPVVTYEIEQVPELIDALLHELDETAIEARFKLDDQHVFPFARDRVLAELEKISRKIEHTSLSIAHDILPAEKVEQKEYL
ncbi:MAG TPA: hypothetical protein P5519_04555 [Spirochaetia bacterium]|nr:hypothetical protein [Spirochaetales bacterium]HPD80136.1 hypothetical protein [Spirochaetales bacterium]HQK33936.1 hypothetical protein [Spirochaetales bacterium]HRS65144.1 hypothetical protein [Spirochaetia bacterium]HRV29983.1 hypothetical protein [Spirochaetia bacterium]